MANISDLPGFKRRVKVSILGYHTASKDDLKNEDLPWAYVLMPPTAGGGMGGGSESLNFTGGEWVFGFFLDGEDAQQPVVLGVFGKSSQVDFRKDIPNTRFEPFSGFSNGAVEPLTNIKQDESVSKTPTGTPDVSLGNNGVKVTKTLANEAAEQRHPQPQTSDQRHQRHSMIMLLQLVICQLQIHQIKMIRWITSIKR